MTSTAPAKSPAPNSHGRVSEPMYHPTTPEIAARRKELAPEIHDAFEAFGRAVFADGALPEKTKQLIAVAVHPLPERLMGQILVAEPVIVGNLGGAKRRDCQIDHRGIALDLGQQQGGVAAQESIDDPAVFAQPR